MRRGVVAYCAAAPAATLCALTGKQVTDWEAHRRTLEMRLFELLKSRLASPTEPLPANHIYATIANPCRLIDEFNFAKTTRRMDRLRISLGFLRRHNVLLHGLLFHVKESKTWNTTAGFGRLALFGESLLRHEVRVRTLRLFPSIDSPTYAALTAVMLNEDALCTLFDRLGMKSLVGAKPEGKDRDWSLTKEQRSNMLCAIVGEMSWFTARTKATDRTHNNALFPPSDALILHVLCCHLLESLPAELIYALVEPSVHRLKKVWVNEPMSLPSQLHLRPRTIGALSLSLEKKPICVEERLRKAEAQASTVCRPFLSPERVVGSVKSTMRPRWNYKRFDERRYQLLSDDKRSCLPLFSSPKTRNSVASAVATMTDERRRELVSVALERVARDAAKTA
ncbi:RNA editing complex protein MP44 [Trypanosoma rangeli]|uniref:RNA editing complex protein MP44 n=1 Tax=Trypanosoma rangeli TaxID=5698 RepID=A0A3R7MNH0_TRYRA|nr:RNA editing complex protein MP44 [Trypanosoma rangeli]RNF08744.1 RNA editing complex protein MP44 [Trypanosoma rangeli]|eukprot:RNF08744.1 RNA editing complex protein MP44 [Trypanosoma rangeli]